MKDKVTGRLAAMTIEHEAVGVLVKPSKVRLILIVKCLHVHPCPQLRANARLTELLAHARAGFAIQY